MRDTTIRPKSTIQAHSGDVWDLNDPREDFRWEDVAYSLGNLCRFNGHCRRFYSVAEHSVHVANLLTQSSQMALYGLLHDAHEAWTGDITAPMKWMLDMHVEWVQNRIDHAVWAKAKLPQPSAEIQEAIKVADLRMLSTECRDLMHHSKQVWTCLDGVEPVPYYIHNPLSPGVAANWWLNELRLHLGGVS